MTTEYPPYFYDEDLKRVTCHSYLDFLLTLNLIKQKGKELDIYKTAALRKYHFVYVDGTTQDYAAWYNLFPALEKDFGLAIDVKTSFAGTSAYSQHILYLKDALGEAPTPVVVVEDVETVEVIEEPSVDPVQEFRDLYNEAAVKASKDAVANLAEEKYNLKVKKNLSFPKMIAFLEEKLAPSE